MDSFKIKCIIPGSETGHQVSVFEEEVAPDTGPPLHLHENQFEVFHVISGNITFEVDGKRMDVQAGGVAVIPPGVAHTFANKSNDPSVIHFELLPSGKSEAFFEKLVAGDFEDVPAFFEKHGLRLLGPPIT